MRKKVTKKKLMSIKYKASMYIILNIHEIIENIVFFSQKLILFFIKIVKH